MRLNRLTAWLVAFSMSVVAAPVAFAQATGFPREVADFGQLERYPAEAAGFHRGRVVEYVPPMSDFSVSYNLYDERLQVAATLYFYAAGRDGPSLFAAEVAGVQQARPGVRVVSQEARTLLARDGATHTAQVAIFAFEDNFAGQRRPLWSQLVLVMRGDRAFKARVTAPAEQGAEVDTRVMRLLGAVGWAE